jgi:hypothetical protein
MAPMSARVGDVMTPGAIVRVCVLFTFSPPPRRRDLGRHGEDGVIFIVSFLVNV